MSFSSARSTSTSAKITSSWKQDEMEAPIHSPEIAGPTFQLSLLPLELLFMVADQLPAPSLIILALSCRSLFAHLCPTSQFPKLNNADLCTVLLMLEKGAPNWYLCFGCTRLRPLKRNSKGGLQGQLHPSCNYMIHVSTIRWGMTVSKLRSPVIWRPQVTGPGRDVPEITFTEAHLVMNRHFYGGSYGLPIQNLESAFDFERNITVREDDTSLDHFPLENHSSNRIFDLRPLRQNTKTVSSMRPSLPHAATLWMFSHRTSAKIINNELFIRRRHSVIGPPCHVAYFSKVLDRLELPVCQHIFGASHIPYFHSSFPEHESETCVPELQSLRMSTIDRQFDVYPDAAIRSCIKCSTDYEISIERGGRHKAWRLELLTYHKLGSCRTPDDPAWASLVQVREMSRPECSSEELFVGGIRHAWFQGPAKTSIAAPEQKGNSKGDSREKLQAGWALPLWKMCWERYSWLHPASHLSAELNMPG